MTQNVQIMDFKEKPPPVTESGILDPLRAPTMWAVSDDDENPPVSASPPTAAAAFDVCHVGVVLRVVLGMQLILLLATLFGASHWLGWLNQWALANAEALPAVLAWLVAVCAARRWLGRQRRVLQWWVVTLLGALAGAYGHLQFAALGWWVGVTSWSPWAALAPTLTGAALGALVMGWLQQRQGMALPQQTQARLVELQARIQPHFLFNTINTAMALIQIDPDRAESVLEDLAELFRRALASPSTRSRLADEVDLAQRYLGIESLRFGDRLQLNWVLDPAADDAVVPHLLLQPLVENAVKHGIEPSPEGGWVRVQTQRQGDRVHITISNSVPAAATQASTRRGHGIALRNVRQRVLLMHDVEARFEAGLQPLIDGPAGQGGGQCHVVRIVMPMGSQA